MTNSHRDSNPMKHAFQINFTLRCHLCDETFDAMRLFRHMTTHGVQEDNGGENYMYLENIRVVITYRECLQMLAEKMRRAYQDMVMRLCMYGMPVEMVPRLAVHHDGIASSLEMIYDNRRSQLYTVELPNSTVERLGFTNWRSLPN